MPPNSAVVVSYNGYCPECDTYIWRAEQSNQKIMQCRCGKIQWRYG